MWARRPDLGYETPLDPWLSPIPHRLCLLSPDSSLDYSRLVSDLPSLPSAFFPVEAFVIAQHALFMPSSFLRTLGLGSFRTLVMGPLLPTSNYDERAKECLWLAY